MSIFKLCNNALLRSRLYSSTSKPKTGILMMNMGGPEKSEGVYDFLLNLFSDREIIKLPFQKYLGEFIAKNRTPKIVEQYNKIGGGSPITKWTNIQGEAMSKILDNLSPETAPHKHYIGFRYVPPFTKDAIDQMQKDGIKRAVAFSQYPQFSCTTAGSSINQLTELLSRQEASNSDILWSLLDRWPCQPQLIQATADHIMQTVHSLVPPDERDHALILFSAHSIPISVVERGDPYPQEVSATVHRVMEQLEFKWPYRLVWQSKVGPKKWLGPHTDVAMTGLSRQFQYSKPRAIILVPIAFTSDHIETLYEMDMEYCGELAHKLNLSHVYRAPAMNDNPIFIRGLANEVNQHLRSGQSCSNQYQMRCPSCTNPKCSESRGLYKMLETEINEWRDRTYENRNHQDQQCVSMGNK